MNRRKKIVVVPTKISLDLPEDLNSVPYFSLNGALRGDVFSPKKEKFQVRINVIPSSTILIIWALRNCIKKEEELLRNLLRSTEIFKVAGNDYKKFPEIIKELELN